MFAAVVGQRPLAEGVLLDDPLFLQPPHLALGEHAVRNPKIPLLPLIFIHIPPCAVGGDTIRDTPPPPSRRVSPLLGCPGTAQLRQRCSCHGAPSHGAEQGSCWNSGGFSGRPGHTHTSPELGTLVTVLKSWEDPGSSMWGQQIELVLSTPAPPLGIHRGQVALQNTNPHHNQETCIWAAPQRDPGFGVPSLRGPRYPEGLESGPRCPL